MRKLIKLAVVALGIRAFLHWRKSRRTTEEATSPAPPEPASDPAEDLRRKLAESREDDGDEAPDAPAAVVADRRAEVHDSGRATLDEMNSSNED